MSPSHRWRFRADVAITNMTQCIQPVKEIMIPSTSDTTCPKLSPVSSLSPFSFLRAWFSMSWKVLLASVCPSICLQVWKCSGQGREGGWCQSDCQYWLFPVMSVSWQTCTWDLGDWAPISGLVSSFDSSGWGSVLEGRFYIQMSI